MCTGTRIVRPLSATARWTACLIHQVAYVENLKPRSGSNLSTAFIKPMLPSWIKSSSGNPCPRYFLAHLDHQAQVPLHEPGTGLLVAGPGPPGEVSPLGGSAGYPGLCTPGTSSEAPASPPHARRGGLS